MMGLTRDQRVLVHQVLWRRRLVAGLFVRYASPVVGSVLVLRFADVERLSSSRGGQYVLQHMPPAMVALRLAGDTLMAVGAWKHRPVWLAVGLLLVVLGWSDGILHGVRTV
ncbi:MAG: hypothetical protein E6I52_26065 [Chloroflexi bacterium]|nr:MAG: hypothetical protein E6I52_26065 [Chloroflexota bacterium]